jgi:hypothetical protein
VILADSLGCIGSLQENGGFLILKNFSCQIFLMVDPLGVDILLGTRADGNPFLGIRVIGLDNPPPRVLAMRIVIFEILVLCRGRIARLVRRRRRRVLKSIAKDIGPNAAFGYPYTK